MTKILFFIAFLLGAIAIFWMSSVFVRTDVLAFTVTMVIGGVYAIGVIELFQFRKATITLSKALSEMGENVPVLNKWLDKLDGSLQNPVRLRIEGERVGLPAPVLSPYFVGLLVMLGLLGTFIGMVDTLRGAVSALEGAAELEAIRDGLAAPIRGLGMAFGTSVAGVATSAMLGLMSTLSKRDRMLETRRLDTKIATVLKEFSLVHSQRETFKALQTQTQALPEVAEKLSTMVDKLEGLGDRLTANQDVFQHSIKEVFTEFALSLDKTHKEGLTESVRLAGESIKPVVQDAMTGISEETRNVHQYLTRTSEESLKEISSIFTAASDDVTRSWKTGLEAHHHLNERLVERTSAAIDGFRSQYQAVTETMVETIGKTTSSLLEHQEENDQSRLDRLTASLAQAGADTATHMEAVSKTFATELKAVTDMRQDSFETATREFLSMSSTLASEWKQAGENSRSRMQEMSDALKETVHDMTTDARATTIQMHHEMAGLLKSSEDLVQARIESEASWIKGSKERVDSFTESLRADLSALREEEEHRAHAAAERLAKMESALASHLADLVKDIEQPMAQLIQTAAEAPHAAAEVIEKLRMEVTKTVERENHLLGKHQRILAELDTLSRSLSQATTEQREAIGNLVDSSKSMLGDVGRRFTDHVTSEVLNVTEVAERFAGSAVEMASLGDVFSAAVNLFTESNGNLIENLARIEESLDRASSRSDEQLGYYVAQAREIIDHCMLSQRDIFEELQQLGQKNEVNIEMS